MDRHWRNPQESPLQRTGSCLRPGQGKFRLVYQGHSIPSWERSVASNTDPKCELPHLFPRFLVEISW